MNNNNSKKIIVYCGKSVEHLCGKQRHPYNDVLLANELIIMGSKIVAYYSNSPDFVSAIKHIGDKHGITTEFFLDGVSHGSEIDPIFADFNKSITLLNERLGLYVVASSKYYKT